MRRSNFLIVGLRALAILSILIIVPLLWRAMARLPWQVDCALATAAAFAFAYRFEREESR